MSRELSILSQVNIFLSLGSQPEQNHSNSKSAHFLPLSPICPAIKISSKLLPEPIHPRGHKNAGITALKLIITLITVMAFVLSRSEHGTKAAVLHTLYLVAKSTLEVILSVLCH